MIKKNIIVLFALAIFSFTGLKTAVAQCAAGEIEIEVFIETDAFGYEGYWSLVKDNSACGVDELTNGHGGNTAVGCNGGGSKAQTPGGYGNNLVFSAGTWCVKEDSVFSLHYVDDWGDGGFGFTVTADGYEILAVDGSSGVNEVFTFTAKLPPLQDVAMEEIHTPFSYSASGNTDLTASLKNKGRDTLTSVDVTYTIDGGSPFTSTLSNLNIEFNEHYRFTHPTAFNLSNGNHTIKVWTSMINGVSDTLNDNDTVSMSFEVGPGTANIIDTYIGIPVNLVVIGSSSNQLNKPTDLDFHPVLSRKELWVVNKRTEAIGGSTVTFSNAGETNQTSVHKKDGNSWHFMSLPTGIAFGENENFGTSPGVFDANHNGGNPFTGPSLWSSDPAIYAQPSGGNGSHLDMLHNSPKSQGIAHEADNVYWVFDGQSSDIVRYDFAEDHGPGASYHGDAIVRRYRDYSVKKDAQDKVVSHLVLDKATNWLYVVDYGNKRVMRLDITSGTIGSNANIYNYEPLAEYKNVVNYTWETVVDTGLQQPSGIDIVEDRMIVSDYATGEIIIYDISVNPAIEKGRITTNAQSIMGVKIGPLGKIWYVDHEANKVMRVDGSAIGISENAKVDFNVFPNPSNGNFTVRFSEVKNVSVEVMNIVGQSVYQNNFKSSEINLDLDLTAGTYFVKVLDVKTGAQTTEKIIVQ